MDYIKAENDYGVYCIPKSSYTNPLPDTIINGGVWEEDTLEFIKNKRLDGDIIHAGAFFGDHLPALAKILNDNERVYTFEPIIEHFECANKTLEWNNIVDSVVLYNLGLCNQYRIVNVSITDEEGNHQGGRVSVDNKHYINHGEKEQIELQALDNIIPEYRKIGTIHLDIEDNERKALEGAMEIIKKNLPIIIVEGFLPKKWFENHLEPLGYKYTKRVDRNTVYSL